MAVASISRGCRSGEFLKIGYGRAIRERAEREADFPRYKIEELFYANC